MRMRTSPSWGGSTMTVSTDSGCLGAQATAALHSIGWLAVEEAEAAAAIAEGLAAAAAVVGVVVAGCCCAEKSARGWVRWGPISDDGDGVVDEEDEEGPAAACARVEEKDEVLGRRCGVVLRDRLLLAIALLLLQVVVVVVVVEALSNIWICVCLM
jgi:hypothetical protein